MAGLSNDGFEGKSTEEVRSSARTRLFDAISKRLNLEPQSPTGALVDVLSGEVASVWDLAFLLWTASDEGSAEGVSLEHLCWLTLTERADPTFTIVECSCTLAPGFSADAGEMQARVQIEPTITLVNKDPAENDTLLPQSVTVAFQVVNPGPGPVLIPGNLEIAVPLVGWLSIFTTGVSVGKPVESDKDLRVRRRLEVNGKGLSTYNGMHARLQEVVGQSGSVHIEVNLTDFVDSNGIPPLSFEAIVYDGTPTGTAVSDLAIARAIWANKGVGDRTYGTTSLAVTDVLGNSRVVSFSRPSPIQIVAQVTIETDPDVYVPAEHDALLKQALVDFGTAEFPVGVSQVVLRKWQCAVFESGIPGIIDVTDFQAARAGDPLLPVNVELGLREFPAFATVNVTVLIA